MDLFKIFGKIAVENAEANGAIDETTDKAEDSGSKIGGAFEKIGSAAVACGKVIATGLAVGAAAVAGLVKSSVENFAEYEQLVGGVETLFSGTKKSYKELYDEMSAQGKSLDEIHAKWFEYQKGVYTVTDNAAEAYKTAGMSTNEYMETVTGFSASLIQSLGGDTAKAAEYAHTAIVDMSDNANKMGSDLESLKTAYAGFSKQNYTMLDNLKLGYGGTKEEMQRLLKDAEKISGQKFDISSYADVVQAIHIMQEEMGIAGTTAKEAAATISGSAQMTKSAWSNLITGMADEEADFEGLIDNFVNSVDALLGNLMPRIEVALNGVVDLVDKLAPTLINRIPGLVSSLLPSIINAATGLINSIVTILPPLIDVLVNDVIPQFLTGVVTIVNSLISALPSAISSIVSALPTLLPQLIDGIISMILTLASNLVEIIQPIIDNLPEIIISIVEALMNNLPALIEGCIALCLGIVSALPEIVQSLVDSIPTIVELIVTALLNSLPDLIMGFIQLVAGVVSATNQIWQSLKEVIPAVFKGIWEACKNVFAPVVDWFGEKWDAVSEKTSEIWQKVSDFFTVTVAEKFNSFKEKLSEIWNNCVDKVTSVFNTIKNAISVAIQFIGQIFSAAFQIITLPFRFIWENCKEYVFAAFEWIKEKINSAITKIKEIAQKGFNFVKEKIINPITEAKDKVVDKFNELKEKAQERITLLKNKVAEIAVKIRDNVIKPIIAAKDKAVDAFNDLRSKAQDKINSLKEKVTSAFNTIKEKIMTPITNAKNKVVDTFNTLKSNLTSKIDDIKSKVTSKFNDIKQKIQEPIEKAKDKIKSIIDKIKGFFDNLKLSLPKIKLPHFKITGKFSLDPPSTPKFSIEWYKKAMNAPLIMDSPTIFGYNHATNSLMGGGEAGSEVVSGTDTLMNMIQTAVSAENSAIAYYLSQIIGILAEFFPEILDKLDSEFDFDDERLIRRIAPGMDRQLGVIARKKERGV